MSFCGAIEMVGILLPDSCKMCWLKANVLGWNHHLQHKHYQGRNRKIRSEATDIPGKPSTFRVSTTRQLDNSYAAVSDRPSLLTKGKCIMSSIIVFLLILSDAQQLVFEGLSVDIRMWSAHTKEVIQTDKY